MNRKESEWVVKDISISKIRSTSSLKAVENGYRKALGRYQRNLRILISLDERYKEAKANGNFNHTRKFDLLFHKRAEIMEYYDDETERLIKIFSDKTQRPVFLHDGGENYVYCGEKNRPKLALVRCT